MHTQNEKLAAQCNNAAVSLQHVQGVVLCGEVASAEVRWCAAGLLGQHNTIASEEIIQGGVLAAMLSLICSAKHKSQLAGLQVLSNLALVSNTAAKKLLSHRLLAALEVGHTVTTLTYA